MAIIRVKAPQKALNSVGKTKKSIFEKSGSPKGITIKSVKVKK